MLIRNARIFSLTSVTVLLLMANFGKHSSVNAIKCFVCDNIGVHEEDEMLSANPLNVNAVCQQFADTKDLMQFAITCPAKYNACQSSHGWTGNPDSDDSHAFRSCFTVPDNAKKTDCREHYIVQGVTSCPCYYDNCNFQSTMIKTGNVWTAVLAGGKSNLAAGGTTKASSAIATIQAGGGGASGVNAGGNAGTNSTSTNTGSVDVGSGGAASALASADANPQDVAARAGSGTGGSGASNTASSLRFHPFDLTFRIKCFVCDNEGYHASDPVLVAHPDFQSEITCHRYADTSELKKFIVDCPAEYNACQVTVGWTDEPDEKHSYRSCMTVLPADRDKKNRHCRNHPAVPDVYSCPCYFDFCNFHNLMQMDANGGLAVLTPNITDKENLAGGETSKAPTRPGNGTGGNSKPGSGSGGGGGGGGAGGWFDWQDPNGTQSASRESTSGALTYKLPPIRAASMALFVLLITSFASFIL
ncbi:hypothetical protein RvY_15097 [Ramazzottius varieornatus]|uniref:Uncharacterized protein n=1 Tax=Ramazzottius varieornatus TaxID=947166 RepID=A0A1D1VTQ2_RAMVA|nr:hypothetical protein RvY_15097 [Ramazzottius varieornatus]